MGRIGQIFKDMVYGAGGAILTRVGAGAVAGLVPAGFAGAPYAKAVVEAVIAVVPVRYVGTRFMGAQQGNIMMLGGLISAGLELADAYLPNIQQQLSGIIRLPVMTAPQAALPAGTTIVDGNGAVVGVSGYSDVEEIDASAFSGYSGYGDVEDVQAGLFPGADGIF